MAKNGEDSVFLLRCCYRTNDIVFARGSIYHYVIDRAESAEHSRIEGRLFNKLESFGEKIAFFGDKDVDKYALKYLWRER